MAGITITEEMIEATARAIFGKSEEAVWLCDDRPNRPDETWEEYLDRLWKADDYERENCIILARAALEAVAPLIAAAETEACAQVAEARKPLYDTLQGQNACAEIASSIRSRKEG